MVFPASMFATPRSLLHLQTIFGTTLGIASAYLPASSQNGVFI